MFVLFNFWSVQTPNLDITYLGSESKQDFSGWSSGHMFWCLRVGVDNFQDLKKFIYFQNVDSKIYHRPRRIILDGDNLCSVHESLRNWNIFRRGKIDFSLVSTILWNYSAAILSLALKSEQVLLNKTYPTSNSPEIIQYWVRLWVLISLTLNLTTLSGLYAPIV